MNMIKTREIIELAAGKVNKLNKGFTSCNKELIASWKSLGSVLIIRRIRTC